MEPQFAISNGSDVTSYFYKNRTSSVPRRRVGLARDSMKAIIGRPKCIYRGIQHVKC